MLSLPLPDASSLRLPVGAGFSQAPRRAVARRCLWKEDHGESSSSLVSYPTDVLRAVQNSGVIACLRADSMELAVEAARAALSGGISLLEIIISTPGVFEAIQELVREYPSSLIGAGTVLCSKDAEHAVQAGAKFLLSPATIKDIIGDLRSSSVLYLPGVMTPTEVLTAYVEGARAVKVYPVSLLGGPQYISALKKPFPNIPMVASQGITIDSIEQYIHCGASAVVLSDAIFNKVSVRQRDFDRICQLARDSVSRASNAMQRVFTAN
ncbi:uncharacterized protein LOC116245105 [Nymphaea colorata]|nr:uncharacterized protein LOC116245105 [Nymphaea colorata]